jgi:hypothetical protein
MKRFMFYSFAVKQRLVKVPPASGSPHKRTCRFSYETQGCRTFARKLAKFAANHRPAAVSREGEMKPQPLLLQGQCNARS